MDVPASKGQFDLNVMGGRDVEVSGKAERGKEEDSKNYIVKERGYSKLYRRFQPTEEVVSEKAEATMRGGVLTVKLPKKQPKPEAKTHRGSS